MQKIKKGDEVIVITGRDKGRKGKILAVLQTKANTKKRFKNINIKVKVEGVQIVKKNLKPDPKQEKPGKVIEKESWIDISNVAILNPLSQKADKIKIKTISKVDAEGKEIREKVRYFKSNDEMVDVA